MSFTARILVPPPSARSLVQRTLPSPASRPASCIHPAWMHTTSGKAAPHPRTAPSRTFWMSWTMKGECGARAVHRKSVSDSPLNVEQFQTPSHVQSSREPFPAPDTQSEPGLHPVHLENPAASASTFSITVARLPWPSCSRFPLQSEHFFF